MGSWRREQGDEAMFVRPFPQGNGRLGTGTDGFVHTSHAGLEVLQLHRV